MYWHTHIHTYAHMFPLCAQLYAPGFLCKLSVRAFLFHKETEEGKLSKWHMHCLSAIKSED